MLNSARGKDHMGNLFSKSQCLPTEQQMPKIGLGLQIHTVSGLNYFSTFEVQLLVLRGL